MKALRALHSRIGRLFVPGWTDGDEVNRQEQLRVLRRVGRSRTRFMRHFHMARGLGNQIHASLFVAWLHRKDSLTVVRCQRMFDLLDGADSRP